MQKINNLLPRKLFFGVMVSSALFLSGCSGSGPDGAAAPGSVLTPAEVSGGRLTPEILWKFARLGEVRCSPDQSMLLFTVTRYNLEQNSGSKQLYTLPVSGGNPVALMPDPGTYSNPRWHPVSGKIWYLNTVNGENQLFEMNPDGSESKQISSISGGVSGFEIDPSGSRILWLKRVKMLPDIHDRHPDLPKADARLISDLGYRHWDSWHDYSYSHIFVAPATSFPIEAGTDLMEGEAWDAPLRPFFDQSDVSWMPDGKAIAYTSKKLPETEAMQSTNSDIYLCSVEDKVTRNLTRGMEGYDKNPLFSPDGRYMAFLSMERPAYEADKNRLMLLNLESGAITDLTEGFDQEVSAAVWSNDSRSIHFISGKEATNQVYEVNIESRAIRQITRGEHDYTSLVSGAPSLIGVKMSISMAPELFSILPESGSENQLSALNAEIYAHIRMGKVEGRRMPTVDGKQMLTWVIYPPDFDPSKKYPTLLFCQGGPQNAVSQFWSYRWNFQLMAANGYIVVAPNRRGLPSFGQEWNDQIAGDYGGLNMQDYLQAVDLMKKEPFVDGNRIGAVGASYGAYSVFWLAGNHEKRFKTFIAHCGIYNLESQYGSTDEYWFVNHDLEGPYWEEPRPGSYRFSPHLSVNKWDTPILIIHGGKDFRIPYTQAIEAFHAAKLRGVSSEFLFFPEEGHWILSPQNSIIWQREFFGWLEKWLK